MTNLIFAVHLVLCLGIVWACICRLNAAICKQYKRARARYSLLLTGALASGLQPVLWQQMPTIGGTILAAAVLACLLINLGRWLSPLEGCDG